MRLNIKLTSLVFLGLLSSIIVVMGANCSALSEEYMRKFSQNNIMFYDPEECISSGGSNNSNYIGGDFDTSGILSAKNHELSMFNGDHPELIADLLNNNSDGSLKRLLENYGELAYELGRAINIPWVAVLVQMHYESPRSECGANNFWGNGCPPGTPIGGSSIKAANLGEGFVAYGKTLTNGLYDAAIGISDPKQYLRTIGPMWVQGEADGAGYGQIKAMEASVDALQAYIDSPEGQSIVRKFKNWPGNSTASTSSASSSASKRPSSNSSSSSSSNGASGTFSGKKYNYDDAELCRIYRAAQQENGCSIDSTKDEMSLMANRTELTNSSSVGAQILSSWFAPQTHDAYNGGSGCSNDELNIARDVINNGNRTVPSQIIEHDYFGDLKSIDVNGQSYTDTDSFKNPSLFIPGKTHIYNNMGGDYIFYKYAGNETACDPMGYSADNPPSSLPSDEECDVANNFIYYNQSDPQWGSSSFGGTTISEGGCGPTSFAMMASLLLGRQISPTETGKIAGDAGMHVPGAGASWEITRVLAQHYGLEYQKLSVSSTQEAVDTVSKYLKEGWMIHTSGQGSTPFTSGGHYIGIRAITADGKWLLADSGHSEETSTTPWEPIDVVNAGMALSNIHAIRSSDGNAYCRSLGNILGTYCSGDSGSSSSSASASLSSGGVKSVADGSGIIDAYLADPLSYNLITPSTGDKHHNCVAFSLWFINHYTDISYDPGATGDGRDFVDYFYNNLKGQYSDLQISNTPSVYALASWGSPAPCASSGNHTGIVVGIDEASDTILIAEAGYNEPSFTGIHEYKLSDFGTSTPTFKYINLNNHLKSNSGLRK